MRTAEQRWVDAINKYRGLEYSWPDAYCCSLAHDLLGGRTFYPTLEVEAQSELRMLANGLRDFGSIGDGHDHILTTAGAKRVSIKASNLRGIRIAWAIAGIIETTRGPVLVDGDTRGIMIFCPSGIVDRLIWTREGLTFVTSTHNAVISRMWRL